MMYRNPSLMRIDQLATHIRDVRKLNGLKTTLVLGSRAGGLFRSPEFYQKLQAFAPFLSLPITRDQQFMQSFRWLQSLSPSEMEGMLTSVLRSIEPSEADRWVATLFMDGYFDPIITTNPDALLELALGAASWREMRDFKIYNLISSVEECSRAMRSGVVPAIFKLFGEVARSNFVLSRRRSHLENIPELKPLLSQGCLVVGFDPVWDAELLYAFPAQGEPCWFALSEEPDEQSRLYSLAATRTIQHYIDQNDGYYERFMVKLGGAVVEKGQILPLPDGDASSQQAYEVKSMASTPEVMIIFDREDIIQLNELKRSLKSLETQGHITIWDSDMIVPGANRKQTIETHFRQASVFLLLVSSHMMASQEAYDLAIRALNRKDAPTVIPVLLTAFDWENTPFGELDPLPANRKPIGSWKNRDEAYLEVAKGLRKVIENLQSVTAESPLSVKPEDNPVYKQPATSGNTPPQGVKEPASPSDQLDYDPKDQPWYASGFPTTTIIDPTQINLLKQAIDVVIITATDVELRAMMRLLKPYPRRKAVLQAFIGPETYYIGKFGVYNAVVTKCRMGAIREGSVIMAATQAQQEWRPRAIIMVGIAFGKDPATQHIADVLVASQIIPYEQMRFGQQIEFRGPITPSNSTLLNRFENAPGWKFPRPDEELCALHIGPILSGEKLIDDFNFKRQLFQQFPRAIGGEMEGAGLCAVAGYFGSAWILIKSICDWADGNKHKQHQPLAAASAVSLVHYVLSQKNSLDAIEKH